MNKRILSALLACVMILLCGCQLADPNAGPETETAQDAMVGVFITTEHLDLFDMEAYLQDNMGSLAEEGAVPADDPRYSGRIYAAVVDNGYEFEDLEGMLLASFWIRMENEGYWASTIGTGLSDVQNKYLVKEGIGTSIEHSANIYLPYNIGEVVFYLNPVYQTKDGEVYLMSGSGISMSTSLGGQLTETVSAEASYTEDGQQLEYNYNSTLTVSCIDVPTEVVFIQMDENHNILRRDSYTPGQLPEEITPEKSAAYILIEEHFSDKILPSVNHADSEYIEVFYRLENDLCVRDQTKVNWPAGQ